MRFALSAFLALVALPALAAHPVAPAAPDVIAPGDLPSFQAVLRSDTPPAKLAAADAPAPMPDIDAAAPVAGADPAPRVMPALFNNKNQYRGDGFAYGSSPQAVQERSIMPATGLTVAVPLN